MHIFNNCVCYNFSQLDWGLYMQLSAVTSIMLLYGNPEAYLKKDFRMTRATVAVLLQLLSLTGDHSWGQEIKIPISTNAGCLWRKRQSLWCVHGLSRLGTWRQGPALQSHLPLGPVPSDWLLSPWGWSLSLPEKPNWCPYTLHATSITSGLGPLLIKLLEWCNCQRPWRSIQPLP